MPRETFADWQFRGIIASVLAEVYRVRLLKNVKGDEAWATAQQLICV